MDIVEVDAHFIDNELHSEILWSNENDPADSMSPDLDTVLIGAHHDLFVKLLGSYLSNHAVLLLDTNEPKWLRTPDLHWENESPKAALPPSCAKIS